MEAVQLLAEPQRLIVRVAVFSAATMLIELALFFGIFWLVHWVQWKGLFSNVNHPPSFYGFPFAGIVPLLYFNKNHVKFAKDTVAKHGPILRYVDHES